MRRRLVLAMALAPIALTPAGCGGGDDGPKRSTVAAADFRFEPTEQHVRAGTTVEWRNTGRTAHTVKGPGFFSRAIEPGATYRHRLDTPGSLRYVCTLHPRDMQATLVVGR